MIASSAFSHTIWIMTDDSITVATTKMLETYQNRWQISASDYIFFDDISGMTDDSFFTFMAQNLSMTDDRLQLFFGSFTITSTMTDDSFFFSRVWLLTMTDDRFSTTADKFQPWQAAAIDVLAPRQMTDTSIFLIFLTDFLAW